MGGVGDGVEWGMARWDKLANVEAAIPRALPTCHDNRALALARAACHARMHPARVRDDSKNALVRPSSTWGGAGGMVK